MALSSFAPSSWLNFLLRLGTTSYPATHTSTTTRRYTLTLSVPGRSVSATGDAKESYILRDIWASVQGKTRRFI